MAAMEKDPFADTKAREVGFRYIDAWLRGSLGMGADARVNCSWSSSGAGGGRGCQRQPIQRLGALNLDLVVSFFGSD